VVRNGYSVVEAQYGEDALLRVRDGCSDLIVLDLDMAAGRWLDVCREIRSETSAPALMLSAQSAERGKVIALDSGVVDYSLMAPFHYVAICSSSVIHVHRYFCFSFDLCGGNGRQFDESPVGCGWKLLQMARFAESIADECQRTHLYV
jgi:hypothetical protein